MALPRSFTHSPPSSPTSSQQLQHIFPFSHTAVVCRSTALPVPETPRSPSPTSTPRSLPPLSPVATPRTPGKPLPDLSAFDQGRFQPDGSKTPVLHMLKPKQAGPKRPQCPDTPAHQSASKRIRRGIMTEKPRGPTQSRCDFKEIKHLGEGSFSIVSLVQKYSDQRYYALKQLKRPVMSVSDRIAKRTEVDNARRVGHHTNIVDFVSFWEESNHLYILSEYCPGGSLKQVLSTHLESHSRCDPNYFLSEAQVLKWFSGLALGLEHIHRCDIIHLDIKPANCLIDSDGTIKIGDFGNSCLVSAPEKTEGDSSYMAPELLSGSKKFTTAADVFSLALTMYEVMTHLELPTDRIAWHVLREEPLEFPHEYNYPYQQPLEELIRWMAAGDPTRRPTASQVAQSPLLVGHQTIGRKVSRQLFAETP